MAEYRYNLTADVSTPPRVRGKFVAYRDQLEAALIALNETYRARAEETFRDQYLPHFADTWSSDTFSAYPEFGFVVQSDSPFLHLLEANTRAGYWPPYSGPTRRHPDRPATRLWDWLQQQRGWPDPPASAWIVARAIFRRGTYGRYRLETAYYRMMREYGRAFSAVMDRVLADAAEDAS